MISNEIMTLLTAQLKLETFLRGLTRILFIFPYFNGVKTLTYDNAFLVNRFIFLTPSIKFIKNKQKIALFKNILLPVCIRKISKFTKNSNKLSGDNFYMHI